MSHHLRRARRLGLLALPVLLACCTAAECEREALPSQGQPVSAEELFGLVQYAARQECSGALYEVLSRRTRDEHGRTKFVLFWKDLEVPAPYEYPLQEVLAYGTLAGAIPGPGPEEQFLYVEYPPPPEHAGARPERPVSGPNLLAQVLVVFEVEEGKRVAHLALQEQVDRRISWDAGGTPASHGGR